MAELAQGEGKPMAGAGTEKVIRDVARILNKYGGTPDSWSKVTSTTYKADDGSIVETHAYQNTDTGEVVEQKSKLPDDYYEKKNK